MTTTPWPDGVIARYLTVVGATLDITDDSLNTGRITARCDGCDWAEYRRPNGYTDESDQEHAAHVAATVPIVRELAQAHAETCRSMPRPEGER